MGRVKKKNECVSNVENMKRYIAKLYSDPALHEQLKQKERDRYKKRKLAGKILQVTTLSERDQRQLKKKWRISKRKQRAKMNSRKESQNGETPPATPNDLQTPPDTASHQQRAGRKKV